MNILAVDDSPNVVELIKEILGPLNYQVTSANNGAQAIDLYDKTKPDFVFLDIAMPVMDGFETLSRLLRLDKTAKVIMTSALEQDDVIQRCLKNGAVGFLTKPFTKEDLLQTIRETVLPYETKYLVSVFKFATNNLYRSIKKIDDETSISLLGIEFLNKEEFPQRLSKISNVSEVRVVPRTISELNILPKDDRLGYVTEFYGRQNGMVVSFIKTTDLQTLFDDQTDWKSASLELFNIFNMKVISELANMSDNTLESNPIRMYEDNDAKITLELIAKASFEISDKQKTIPFELNLCFKTPVSVLQKSY